jgi:hypothetical protein
VTISLYDEGTSRREANPDAPVRLVPAFERLLA